jgi:hypothetical protein
MVIVPRELPIRFFPQRWSSREHQEIVRSEPTASVSL